MKTQHCLKTIAALVLIAVAGAAIAGRPLAVDDAGINAEGEGHVELWSAHTSGATSFNVSPAFAFWSRVELAALLSRDNGNKVTATALQAKWMITPSQDDGCNAAAALGTSHVSADLGSGNARFVSGIFSCNGTALGNVHINLGYAKPTDTTGVSSWGVALERSFGALTPHVEVFGAEQTDTAVQLGLRGDIAKNIQLDGSVGRVDRSTVYTLGLKFRF